MSTPNKPRGGARPNAGRPRLPVGETTRPHTITLPDTHYRWAKILGNGNASLGIRRALEAHLKPSKD